MFQWLWAVLRLPWLMQEGDPPRPDPVPEKVVKLSDKAKRKRAPRPPAQDQ